MTFNTQQFDIAVSFAGENRAYVQNVVDELKRLGVSVFYDRDAEIEIWGNDLVQYLQDIYGTGKAKFCVIFVSRDYHLKKYTKFELQNAAAYSLNQPGYILPVKLDDTELPKGVLPSIAYLDGRKLSTEDLAKKIATKVGKETKSSGKQQVHESYSSIRTPRLPKKDFDAYEEAENFVSHIKDELGKRSSQLKEWGLIGKVIERTGRNSFRVLRGDDIVYGLNFWLGGGMLGGDNTLCFSHFSGRNISGDNSYTAFGDIEWSKERNQAVLNFTNMSLLNNMGQKYILTKEEFVDELWNNIVDSIETRYR